MADTKVSALTSASTLVGTETFPCVQSTNSRKATGTQLRALIRDVAIVHLAADYTLTSTTSAQKLFNSTTNGRLTLTTGVYRVEGLIHINTMSATSGNAQFGLVGAGTATLAGQLFYAVGVDGAAATAATQTGSTTQGGNTSPASAMTAGTGTAMTLGLRGAFECTAAGTIVPSIALVTAAAAVVKRGSFLLFYRMGGAGFASSDAPFGGWD